MHQQCSDQDSHDQDSQALIGQVRERFFSHGVVRVFLINGVMPMLSANFHCHSVHSGASVQVCATYGQYGVCV